MHIVFLTPTRQKKVFGSSGGQRLHTSTSFLFSHIPPHAVLVGLRLGLAHRSCRSGGADASSWTPASSSLLGTPALILGCFSVRRHGPSFCLACFHIPRSFWLGHVHKSWLCIGPSWLPRYRGSVGTYLHTLHSSSRYCNPPERQKIADRGERETVRVEF